MDNFIRNYLIILAGIAISLLAWVFYEDPAVSKLNAKLKENTEVAAYPYPFRVMELNNQVATMGTPRSADFSAINAPTILFPELRKQAVDSATMTKAQQDLAHVQSLAQHIVMESDEVKRVVWRLDEKWLRQNGVDPDLL